MASLHERLVTIPKNCPPGFSNVGGATTMPALHPDRAEKITFVIYKTPPSSDDKAGVDEWMTRTMFIEDDLRWLLSLPHDRFWCQAIFNSSLHQCIRSYLHNAPRPHDLEADLCPDLRQKNDSLLRLFFFVCLRMSTHKESKDCHIEPGVFGEIIYEHYIFDITKIMDICVVYGKSNETLVKKMVANIFTQQPKYYDDLGQIVSTTLDVFSGISKTCGFLDESMSPKRLTTSSERRKSPLISMNSDQFQEIIMYISDIAYTLDSFLEIFPQGSTFFSREHFPQRLAGLYEAASAGFAAAFQERGQQRIDVTVLKLMKRTFYRAKVSFLQLFHKILFHTYLEPLLESNSVETSTKNAEGFLNVITACLSEKRFLADLQALFPFDEDKDILSQSVYKIDAMRLKYIDDAVHEATTMYGQKKKEERSVQTVKPNAGENVFNNDNFQTEDENYHDPYEGLGAYAPKKTGVELESLISSVKDLFSDLGDGFIEVCLAEYNYNSEQVISAILENDLKPSLRDVERSLKRNASSKELTMQNTLTSEVNGESLMGQRANIYDGDEFDAFQHKIDTLKVHMGKKNKTYGNDKSELSNLKSFYKKFDQIVEYTEVTDADDYNDEYDDTYDSNVIGTIDDDSADEMMARRPIVTPRVLEKVEPKQRVDSSSDEENSEDEKRRDHFLQDPAKLRQIREEKFAARIANQRGGRPHPASSNSQEKNRDVKGGPRGQGQSSEVLRNRAYKERHKDARVHHNRRELADRKRKF